MVLQGQDSENSAPDPPTPTNPNRTDISWKAAVAGSYPVDHYQIYRSTDGTAYGTSMTTAFSDTAATHLREWHCGQHCAVLCGHDVLVGQRRRHARR